MTTIPDHYAALGIDPTADPEVITAAYRALAKKFHPDTGAAAGTADAARFDAIQQAYEVLRAPESRHAYDLELLAATEAELEQHIASKRRVAVRERERAAEEAAAAADKAAAAAPDLGDIRPEPAVPPRAAARPRRAKPRSVLPFIVPVLLMMLVGGAGAWFLLPAGPDAPPLPGTKPEVAVATPAPQPAPAPKPAVKPAVEPAAQPAAPAPSTEAEQPVFGSTGATENPPAIEEAAATPEPASDEPTVVKSDKPVFGSDVDGATPAASDLPAATAPPPPVPKAKPAQPAKQVAQSKPVAKKTVTVPKSVPQQQATQQPRARLAYQDPPQYYPEPDGYPPPPPGMEPPGYPSGYYDQGYGGAVPPPPGFRTPGGGPYRLVIFERLPGRQATAFSTGAVFKSVGKCTRQGVKAVLRRTGGMESDGTRVWYECQQLSQR